MTLLMPVVLAAVLALSPLTIETQERSHQSQLTSKPFPYGTISDLRGDVVRAGPWGCDAKMEGLKIIVKRTVPSGEEHYVIVLLHERWAAALMVDEQPQHVWVGSLSDDGQVLTLSKDMDYEQGMGGPCAMLFPHDET